MTTETNGERARQADTESTVTTEKLVPGATFPDYELTGHDRQGVPEDC